MKKFVIAFGIVASFLFFSCNEKKADTVKFLSRTDWAGTFPVAYPGLEITSDMEIYLGKNRGNGPVGIQFLGA